MKIAVTLLACLVALSQDAAGSQLQYSVPALHTVYSSSALHPTYGLPLFRFSHPVPFLRTAYDFDTIRKTCSSINQLPSWELYKGNKVQFFNDYRTKQYLKCYLSGLNTLTLDGRFNPLALISIVGEGLSYPINACASATNLIADPYELSYQLVKCLDEQDPQILRAIGILHPTY